MKCNKSLIVFIAKLEKPTTIMRKLKSISHTNTIKSLSLLLNMIKLRYTTVSDPPNITVFKQFSFKVWDMTLCIFVTAGGEALY